MSFVRNDMKRAKDALRVHMPRALRANLDKASKRLGTRGVRIAKTLAAVDSGRTRSAIKYATVVSPDGPGWQYSLVVYVDARDKPAALAAFVTEFGRGHGRDAARARGSLPARPFIRLARSIIARTSVGSFRRAMRDAAKQGFDRR